MAVTDLQFKQMLRGQNGAKPTMLAEIDFAYQTGSGPAVAQIYLANRRFRSKPTDAPANIRYRDVIMSDPQIERSIDVKKLGGRGTMTAGSLTLDNADGNVDFLLDAIMDGREIRFYMGDQSWARNDFRLVNVALVASVKATSDAEIQLQLRDKSYLLDDTIIGDTIASGPNAGKPKPILLGVVRNFDLTPYLLDLSTLTYALSTPGAPTFFVKDVRDVGLSLTTVGPFAFSAANITVNTATDTLTSGTAHNLSVDDVISLYSSGAGPFTLPSPLQSSGISTPSDPSLTASAHQYWVIATGLTANNFKLSLTRGGVAIDLTTTTITGGWGVVRRRFYVDFTAMQIQLSSSPQGRPTVDTENDGSTSPHSIFKTILQHYTELRSSEYDATAIDAMAATETLAIDYGRAVTDRVNVLDLLDEIALASYSWYSWTAAGVLTVGRLDLSNLDLVAPIDSVGVNDMEGDLQVENLPLPWGKVILDADPNVVVQADGLSPDVAADDRTRWGQPYQSRVSTTDPGGTDYLGNWWDYHKSAIDSKPVETQIANVDPAAPTYSQGVVDATTALFAPWTRQHTLAVGADKYALNPGDCVKLTYRRYGLSAGKNMRVMSVKPRFTEGLCDLVLVRKTTPDYLTSSRA